VQRPHFAFVGPSLEAPKVRHYQGLPPALTGGDDQRVELPRARVVVLEESDQDGAYLHRYDEFGKYITDTWHETIDDAKDHASFEYGSALGVWSAVPVGVVTAEAINVDRLISEHS
jgi:hypothetical protein